MKTYKTITKLTVLVLLFALLAACFTGCGKKSAEELIKARIEAFVDAYNSGDIEEALESLDAKTRNAAQATLNLLGAAAGKLTGIDIDLSDLFSLGIMTASGDFMIAEIESIRMIDEENAAATVRMNLDGGEETVYFTMVSDDDDWFIADIDSKKSDAIAALPPEEGEDGGYAIVEATAFSDGIAVVTYWQDGAKCRGMIDTDGNILFSIPQAEKNPDTLTPIGKGGAVICHYDSEEDEYVADSVVNRDGTVVAQLEGNAALLAYGDGLALLYRKEIGISSSDLCGIIDTDGNWALPMTAAEGDGSIQNDGFRNNYYAGDGVFALEKARWYSESDYLLLDSNTGKQAFVTDFQTYDPYFFDGKAYVHLDDLGHVFLHADGTTEECNTGDRSYQAHGNGVVVTEQDNIIYIGDSIVYDKYPDAEPSVSSFTENYWLLSLSTKEYRRFITMLDRNGTEMFEPILIEMGYYADLEYSDDVAIFKREGWLYCILDASGNMVETDYLYMEPFSDGLAPASADGSTWVYVDASGNVVLSEVK